MRRIIGFDAQSQTVQLEGDSATEIQPTSHHTLEVSALSEPHEWDYWGAAANVHDSSGGGTVLFRSVNDDRLKLVPFGFAATPGITVMSSTEFVTTEDSGQVILDVVLDTQPTSDVTLAVDSSDLSEGTVDTTSLSFDAANWDTPQQVIVTGVDDADIDGDVVYTVSLDPSSSLDADYAGLAATNLALTNLDNENQPPVVADDSYSAIAGETLQVAAPGLLSNDTDPDGDNLTVNLTPVSAPTGTLTLSSDGAFSYSAASGFSETDTFVYEISDGNGGTATAQVTIDVTDPPVGDNNDIYVWDINFQTRQRGKFTDLRIAADVNRDSNAGGLASDSDGAAAGVLVVVELRDTNGALIQTFEGTTDDTRTVQFDWVRDVDAGDYTAEAVDLAHQTFNWNHALDLGFDDEDRDGDGLPDELLTL